MKRIFAVLLIFILIFAVYGCSEKEDKKENGENESFELPKLNGEPGDWEFYNSRAEYFVISMANGDFDSAFEMFDDVMAPLMPAASLKNDLWDNIIPQAGAFVEINKIENTMLDGYYVCFTTSEHKKTGVTLRVVFSENGSISGLFVDGYPEIEKDG